MAADAEALASFLPQRLVRRLAEAPEGAGRPHADRMTGALLLADISGFTAITERLAERGPGGAEELRGLLYGAFQPLLELIAGTGGDVLKFAGDALLACWPAPPGDLDGRGLAAATAAAACCAEAMQAALGRYAAAERLPLALRIGVGAGEVVVLDVGGERERRELLVAGAAVPQTTGAAGQARPGQVSALRGGHATCWRATSGARRGRAVTAAAAGPDGQRRAGRPLPAPGHAGLDGRRPRGVAGRAAPDHGGVRQPARPGPPGQPGRGPGGDGGPPGRPVPLRGQHQQAQRRREGHHPGGGARAAAPGPRGRPGQGRPGRRGHVPRPWPPAAAGSRSG